MKNIIAIISSLILLSTIGCEKAPAPTLEILDVAYRVNEVNSWDLCYNDGFPLTNITVVIDYKAVNVSVTDIENQYINESGTGGTDNYSKDEAESFDESQITFTWCYGFGQNNFWEETFKLTGVNSMGGQIVSNPKMGTISRPDGAN